MRPSIRLSLLRALRLAPVVIVALLSFLHGSDANAQRTFTLGLYTWTCPVDSIVSMGWYTDGFEEDRVTLEYTTDSMRSWKLIDTLPARGMDVFDWRVPNDTTSTGFVRIAVNDTTRAISDQIEITHGTLVRRLFIESPPVVADSTVFVTWYNRYTPGGTYFLDYSTDSVTWKFIAARSLVIGTLRYQWTVPRDPSPRAWVRLRWDGVVRGISERFEILGRGLPRIDIATSPGLLFSGDTTTVRWSLVYPEDVGDSIIVEYAERRGAAWERIAARAPTAPFDSVRWVVPDDTTSSGQIRVRSLDGSVFDTTSATILIRPRPYVRLLRPNGGEQVYIDSQLMVVWDSRTINGNFTLEYSIDSGSTWLAIIARHTAREGLDSVAWIVPASPSTGVVIRIAHEEGTAADTTDSPFAILQRPSHADGNSGERMSTLIAPNPTNARRVTAHWWQKRPGPALLRVHSLDGSLERTIILGDADGGENSRSVELDGLPSGWYHLEVVAPDGVTGTSVIVQ